MHLEEIYLILQIFNCYMCINVREESLQILHCRCLKLQRLCGETITYQQLWHWVTLAFTKNLRTSTILRIYRLLNHVGQTNALANALRDWKWLTLYWVCINCRAKDVEPRWSTNRWQWRWDDQQNYLGPSLLCVICCRTVSCSYKIGLQT